MSSCYQRALANSLTGTGTCPQLSTCVPGFANCYYCADGSQQGWYLQLGRYYGAGPTCYQCPAGQYAGYNILPTTSACSGLCAPGQYSGMGAAACDPCPAGQYNTWPGASGCTACPSGQYSTGGVTSCTACSCGALQACYQDGTSGTCWSCPGGPSQGMYLVYNGPGGTPTCAACAAVRSSWADWFWGRTKPSGCD